MTLVAENPADPSKILIGFASGTIALWDLSTRKQEEMYQCAKKFTSISWHYEGKQFVCSCVDGSLVTWNIKPVGKKPASIVFPHREKGSDSSEPLAPIDKVRRKMFLKALLLHPVELSLSKQKEDVLIFIPRCLFKIFCEIIFR